MGKYNAPTPEQQEIENLQAQGVNGTAARLIVKLEKRIEALENRLFDLEIDIKVLRVYKQDKPED